MTAVQESDERCIPGQSDNYWQANHLARYTFAKSLVENKIVLDVGCGEGYGANLLAQVAQTVVAIDIDEHTIQRAQLKYAAPNLRFATMDSCRLDFSDGSFDVVCSFEVLEHVSNCQQYLSEIRRVLRKGGAFLVSTPNKERYPMAGMNPFHEREFTLDEFRRLLGEVFEDVVIYGQRCKLEARALYHTPLANLIYRARRRLGIGIRCPKGLRQLIERTLTGHSIQEATIGDFDIVPDRLEEAEEFIAICHRC